MMDCAYSRGGKINTYIHTYIHTYIIYVTCYLMLTTGHLEEQNVEGRIILNYIFWK